MDNVQMLDAGDEDPLLQLGLQGWRPELRAEVALLTEDSAAGDAGIEIGDLIVRVGDANIENWSDLVFAVQPNPDTPLLVQVERDGRLLEFVVTPKGIVEGGKKIGLIGVGPDQTITPEISESIDRSRVTVRYPPVQAFGKALARTWEMSVLTVRLMGKLITGQASLQNISGPISIAQFAGQSVSVGLDHYINFIAMISLSIAILNLLPIPMLDGGHLLFFLYEALRGKPLPEKIQIMGHQLGLVILGSLMFLAFYNDFWRLLK
jgi:regulator of sigma E protease